jgi:mono/diheme cytochrome c family protein
MDGSSPRSFRRVGAPIGLAVSAALVLVACSPGGDGNPLAARGRQVYLAQCTSCHAMSPSDAGPVGPPVKGASRELLETKILRGTYPPGYKPKRPTQVMPPQPQLANDIDAVAEFLK